jgi:predicted nuclease with TOPRIM domain
MITEQKRAEMQAKHEQLQREHKDFMNDAAQTEIEQTAFKAEIKALEEKNSKIDDALRQHDEDKKMANQFNEDFEKEMSGWTVCSNAECGFIDDTGGATCPECGSETRPYEYEAETV